jgi:hypothetical protein
VSLRSAPGSNRRFNRTLEPDARFHFALENIPPGTYELTVRAVTHDGKDALGFDPVKQTVTVTNGADSQLTVVFETKKGDR